MAGTMVALLVSGCGVLSTKEDRRRAGELAESVYPGELRLVGARTLFPARTGSEVTFALRDDPDAFVRLHVDAGNCSGEPCARSLREARAQGEAAAAEWRLLRREFARCGYEVHAVTVSRGTVTDPWVARTLTNDNVTDVLTEVGTCLERFSRALGDERAAGRTHSTVHIAHPSAAGRLPAGREDHPTLLRRTAPERHAALGGRLSYAVAYTWRDGVVQPASGAARIVRPFRARQEFTDKVHAAAGAWLARERPGAEPVRGYTGVWRLIPGRVDRQRGWVLFCDGPPRKGERCLGERALQVTVDLEGRPVDRPAVVNDIRDERGVLRLPPLG
jgi:hypothetical protein